MAGNNVLEIIARLDARTEAFNKKLDAALRHTRTFGDKAGGSVAKIGQAFARAGKSVDAYIMRWTKRLAMMSTAAGAAAVAFSVKSAAGFDKGMREVNTLLELGEAEFKVLNAEVLKLSKTMGVNATDATHALYQAISAGVPKENALAFLRTAAESAIGGLATTESAVSAFTNAMNAWKIPFTDTARVADGFFMTVKKGVTTFPELAANIGNVSSVAAAAGVSFEETMASIATITKGGKSTAEAGTALRAAITSLLAPNEDMLSLLDQIGFKSGEALLKQKGLQGALAAIAAVDSVTTKEGQSSQFRAKKLQDTIKQLELDASAAKTEEKRTAITRRLATAKADLARAEEAYNRGVREGISGIAKALGSTEALQATLMLTGQNARTAGEDMRDMGNSMGAARLAFLEMEKSDSRKWEKFVVYVQALGIEFGQKVLPHLEKLMPMLERAADALGRWIETRADEFLSDVSGWIKTAAQFTKEWGVELLVVYGVLKGLALLKGAGVLAWVGGLGKMAIGGAAAGAGGAAVGGAAAGAGGAAVGSGGAKVAAGLLTKLSFGAVAAGSAGTGMGMAAGNLINSYTDLYNSMAEESNQNALDLKAKTAKLRTARQKREAEAKARAATEAKVMAAGPVKSQTPSGLSAPVASAPLPTDLDPTSDFYIAGAAGGDASLQESLAGKSQEEVDRLMASRETARMQLAREEAANPKRKAWNKALESYALQQATKSGLTGRNRDVAMDATLGNLEQQGIYRGGLDGAQVPASFEAALSRGFNPQAAFAQMPQQDRAPAEAAAGSLQTAADAISRAADAFGSGNVANNIAETIGKSVSSAIMQAISAKAPMATKSAILAEAN